MGVEILNRNLSSWSYSICWTFPFQILSIVANSKWRKLFWECQTNFIYANERFQTWLTSSKHEMVITPDDNSCGYCSLLLYSLQIYWAQKWEQFHEQRWDAPEAHSKSGVGRQIAAVPPRWTFLLLGVTFLWGKLSTRVDSNPKKVEIVLRSVWPKPHDGLNCFKILPRVLSQLSASGENLFVVNLHACTVTVVIGS